MNSEARGYLSAGAFLPPDSSSSVRSHIIPIGLAFGAFLIAYSVELYSVLGQGALSMGDERRYLGVLFAVEQLIRNPVFTLGDFLARLLESTHGRPSAAIWWIAVALVHRAWAGFVGVDLLSPAALMAAQIANAALVLVTMSVFYKIASRMLGSNSSALLVTICYSQLPSNFLFVRHLLPYQLAISFHLLGIWSGLKAIEQKRAPIWWTISGFCAGLGFSAYPGFYWAVAFPVALALCGVGPRSARTVQVIAGIVTPLLVWELVSLGAHVSYTDRLHALALTVNQGSHTEALSFPWRYFRSVEGWLGIAVLFGLVGAPVFLMWAERLRHWKEMRALLVVTVSGLLLHGMLSWRAELFVFYGRLCLVAAPVGLLACQLVFERFANVALRNLCRVGMLVAALSSGYMACTALRQIAYPRDILYQMPERSMHRVAEIHECERVERGPMPLVPQRPETISGALVLENFCSFFPVHDGASIPPPQDYDTVFSAPHYLQYEPYLFETYTPKEREIVRSVQPRIQVWSRRE